jgi:hypothetical protein
MVLLKEVHLSESGTSVPSVCRVKVPQYSGAHYPSLAKYIVHVPSGPENSHSSAKSPNDKVCSFRTEHIVNLIC